LVSVQKEKIPGLRGESTQNKEKVGSNLPPNETIPGLEEKRQVIPLQRLLGKNCHNASVPRGQGRRGGPA